MKATELMIADWVRIAPYDIIDQVDCLLTEYAITSHGDSCGQYDYKDIEPIPLTPEILEKNGFDKWEDDGGVPLWSLPLWSLDKKEVRYCMTFEVIDGGCPVLTIEDVVDGDSRHTSIVLKDEVYNVHDLQHVLRFLGLEIQIII